MCFVSVRDDLDYSDSARARSVSRTRTYPTRTDRRGPSRRQILEERYPSKRISFTQTAPTRSSLLPSRINTNQSYKRSSPKRASSSEYNPERSEGRDFPSDPSKPDRSAHQSATVELQPEPTFTSPGTRNNDLSRYIEVEFYSTSSSSSSSEPIQDKRSQTASRPRAVYRHSRSTPPTHTSKDSRERNQNLESESTYGRDSRGRYTTERREAEVSDPYEARRRG